MVYRNLIKWASLTLAIFLIATVAYSATVGGPPKHIIFKGQNTEAGPLDLDDGESPDCLNVRSSVFGSLLKRNGYTKLNSAHNHITTSPGKVNGLFDYAIDTTTRKLMGYLDNHLYRMDDLDGNFDRIEFATAMSNDVAEFENYDGDLILATWSRDLAQSWTGVGTTTSDITDMPKGRHVIQAYTRIFISNVNISDTIYPLRFYFSNPGSYTAWTTASDYETLDAPQGDEAMGWGLLKGRLFGFTKYTVNLVSDVGGNDPIQVTKRIDGVGCGAPRTIKTVNAAKGGESLIWLSQDKKLYSWNGSTLTEISLRIHNNNKLSSVYMDAINDTNLKYCHAQVYEKEGWYVLFIPIDTDIDYAIIYDINTGALWPLSNQNFWSSALVETSSGTFIYCGETTGGIHKWDDGQSDNGTAISSYWTSRRWHFGSYPYIKKMGEVRIITKTIGNYPLYYQYRYNFSTSWSTQKELTMFDGEWLLGDALPATLGGHEAQSHRLTIPGSFNAFQIKLTDNSSNPAWEIYSLDIATNVLNSIGD